jgi:prepilin peptidase CpaA
MILDTARLLLFPALVAFAAMSDLLTMRISNWVSLTLVTGFLIMAPMSGMGLHDILMHFAAGATVLAVAFACFAIGQVGGADAKVAAAVALWFGFDHLMNFLIDVSLLGGALTILLLLFRSWPLPPFLARQDWLDRLHSKRKIPYGVALALGALIVYPETQWIKAIDLTQIAMR